MWAAEWLQELLIHEKIELTPDIKEAIWHALDSLSQTPVKQRTLSGLLALLQDFSLRKGLQTFTLSGPFGALLDAHNDSLQKSNWLCFEIEELMSMPSVVMPVLSYLFHRLEQDFKGEPTLIILDEAWLFLNHPAFVEKIRDWLKSLRKKNISVIFATQSVADAALPPISPTLLESCPGRIFLPNDRALEPQIQADYLRLGLNEKQLELLANAMPKKHYYYQSRLGNRLFSLELGDLARALCGASSPLDLAWMRENPFNHHHDFVKAFLEYKNLNWALRILEEASYDSTV